VDRIKRLSYEVLDEHKSQFGEDFTDNKKVLDQISIIRSKSLKNKIAGYITRFIKKEIREEKAKQAQIASSQSEDLIEEEVQAEIPEPTTTSKEISTEILTETSPVEEKTE
jgi:small subunit ribosomal protein S17e